MTKIKIRHNIEMSSRRNVGMLLPFGLKLHQDLVVYLKGTPFANEKLIGSVAHFLDGKGVIKAVSIVNATTAFVDALSKMLYGMSAKKLLTVLNGSWEGQMEANLLVFLVVDTRVDVVRGAEGFGPQLNPVLKDE